MYIAPGNELPENNIKKLFQGTTPTIAAGDKHIEWNSKIRNARGRKLKRLADNEQIVIIGPDATHMHMATNLGEAIDKMEKEINRAMLVSTTTKAKIELQKLPQRLERSRTGEK